MSTDLKEKRQELEAEATAAAAIAAKGDEATGEEVAEGYQRLEKIKTLKADIAAEEKKGAFGAALGDLTKDLKSVDDVDGSGADGALTEADIEGFDAPSVKRAGRDMADAFLGSDDYRGFIKSHADADGEISKNTHVEIRRVYSKRRGQKIVTEGSVTSGGALLAPDERGLIDVGPFQRPMTLRDLITVGRTGQAAVRYARVTGFTNAATGVHEASTATGTNAAGGLKPESALALAVLTANVVTIAHLFTASKQSLSDVPLMRTLIENYGMYGLREEEEDQIIAGTGSANDQLDGFNTVSGMQTQAFATDIPTSVSHAKVKVRKIGRARPNGVLMNLEDEETVQLLKDTTGRYLGNGPWSTGPQMLWGLPIVSTDAVPAAKAYVADFRTIALLVREDPSVAITDSHADYFARNLIAMLFEERATQLVFRPKAICEVATA